MILTAWNMSLKCASLCDFGSIERTIVVFHEFAEWNTVCGGDGLTENDMHVSCKGTKNSTEKRTPQYSNSECCWKWNSRSGVAATRQIYHHRDSYINRVRQNEIISFSNCTSRAQHNQSFAMAFKVRFIFFYCRGTKYYSLLFKSFT